MGIEIKSKQSNSRVEMLQEFGGSILSRHHEPGGGKLVGDKGRHIHKRKIYILYRFSLAMTVVVSKNE